MVSENICLQNFHTEYGKRVATVPLFSETSDKEFSNILSEELKNTKLECTQVMLMYLLLRLSQNKGDLSNSYLGKNQ